MPSPPPLAYDTYYHIYNRGNNRETIIKAAQNYPYFLKLYTKHIYPVAETFAYCLLPNHFHLLIRTRTPEEQLAFQADTLKVSKTFRVLTPSQQFSNMFNAYTKSINKRYQRTGSLFEHPFGRIDIDSDAYFTQLIIYIHQNPQKHALIDNFRRWHYSSYKTLLSNQPTQLNRELVLSWFNGRQPFQLAHHLPANEDELRPLLIDQY